MKKVKIAYREKIFETTEGNWKILKRMSNRGIKIGIDYLKKKGAWKEIKEIIARREKLRFRKNRLDTEINYMNGHFDKTWEEVYNENEMS